MTITADACAAVLRAGVLVFTAEGAVTLAVAAGAYKAAIIRTGIGAFTAVGVADKVAAEATAAAINGAVIGILNTLRLANAVAAEALTVVGATGRILSASWIALGIAANARHAAVDGAGER